MAQRTFKDWQSWRDGLRSCVMRAGATAVTTQLATLGGTNAVASMNIPGLQNIALQWKTALVALIVQFVFHCIFAAASYIQNNPDPQTVTTTDTTFINKTDGTISQSSSTINQPTK